MSAKIQPKPAKPSKPSKDTVYIDVDDEITAIIDKVEGAKEKVVALVLPKRTAALQSIVNMRLLKRSAEHAAKSVVLITSETALLPLAGAAKLHVAKNLQSKPDIPPSPVAHKEMPEKSDEEPSDEDEVDEKAAKLDYHRSIGELAAAGTMDEPESISLDEPAEAAPAAKAPKTRGKGLKIPDFDRFRLLMGLGILGVVALIIFLIFAIWVLPKATITVSTTSTPLSASFNLKALDSAKTLDEDKAIIPSVLKTSQQTGSQQVPATGQQNNGQKATGTIKIINCSQDGSPITVPAGTGLTANGLTFITQSAASLPNSAYFGSCKSNIPNTSASVDVASQNAGAKYNIGPSSFSVAGFSSVQASSSKSMAGGTDNIVTVVSQQDVDNAKSKITAANSDEFSKKFQKDLENQGYYFLSSTLKLGQPNTTASPTVGSQATTVNVTTQITYTVMVVKRDDLKQSITHQLNKQVDTKKQQISSPDVVKDATISVGDQTSSGSGTLSIDENTTAVPIIDVSSLKTQAKGHKKADVQGLLSGVDGVKSIDVKFSPFWVSKTPKSESKIKVVLHEIKSKQ